MTTQGVERKPPVSVADLAHKLALTVPEVMALTGIGEGSIAQAIKDGSLRAKAVGRDRHILRADLDAWLESLPAYTAERPARIVPTTGPRRSR